MIGEWLNYEVTVLRGQRDPSKEKHFILRTIKPFIESNRDSVSLFHFTRIFKKGGDNLIRWRLRPSNGQISEVEKLVDGLLKGLKQKGEVIEFQKKSFGVDTTHNKLGGEAKNYDVFLEYLDAISRITMKLLARGVDAESPGYIASPDYYAHFLFNQFGSHSDYCACPRCGKGSLTAHRCFYCGQLPIIQESGPITS